ncbi:hypothetical protein [Microvirga sp. CF3016]|uniref:hypothetical protein n=1 Tax=Microvirga sp. CF3016 TaxID=3110181 RepID=UPI002E778B49|nr:hypothetical protein [Microvirga sp. CF3016]MEE1612074.1 hypothetical protein [Microvirga sp. CF3016]
MNRGQEGFSHRAALKDLADALPDASGADADLIALCRQYLGLYVERDRFWAEIGDPADLRYHETYPSNPPEEIFVKGGDYTLLPIHPTNSPWKGRLWYGDDIERLRQPIMQMVLSPRHGAGRIPDARANARAKAIVEAWDCWTAAREEARVQSGLADAEEQDSILFHQLEALFDRIATSHATTLAGCLAKALCAQCASAHPESLETELSERLHTEEGSPAALSLSIARDLVASAPGIVPVPNSGADAELIRLGKEFDALIAQLDDPATEDELYDEVEKVQFAMHRIPAKTLAGLAVKAHVIQTERLVASPDPGQPLLTNIVAHLVADVLRLAGQSKSSGKAL